MNGRAMASLHPLHFELPSGPSSDVRQVCPHTRWYTQLDRRFSVMRRPYRCVLPGHSHRLSVVPVAQVHW